MSPDEHWLLHTEHHLLHDGWGYGVFLRELFAAYDALAAGRQPDLPPLAVQFADCAAWQRRQIDRGVWNAQLDYWVKTLGAAPTPARLPPDATPPASQTFYGDQIRHPMDRRLYADVVAACLREHVTPYMWLHAAFQTFVHRYTGVADIIVGSGIANRRTSESQHQLGMMINTVALRIDFDGDPTFRDVLAKFRRAATAAVDNQDAPYEKIILRLKRGTELFTCFFDSYDQSFAAYRNDRVRVESLDGIGNGTCKFDLIALVIPGDGAPTLLWEYNTDLWCRESAERMMHHFLGVVRSSVNRPDTHVSALPMLAADERDRLLALGRGPETTLPGDRLERIFAAQASARPDAEAVVCGGERVTFAELERRADDLAARLQAHGVERGVVVAFSQPRGTDAIATMLGILKCGCAYMPLDPTLPPARAAVDHCCRRRARHERRDHDAAGALTHGRRRVRDVHVGIDRRTQGRVRAASRRGSARLPHRLRPPRHDHEIPAACAAFFRCLHARDLGIAAEWRDDSRARSGSPVARRPRAHDQRTRGDDRLVYRRALQSHRRYRDRHPAPPPRSVDGRRGAVGAPRGAGHRETSVDDDRQRLRPH
jgi:hypothetical protein